MSQVAAFRLLQPISRAQLARHHQYQQRVQLDRMRNAEERQRFEHAKRTWYEQHNAVRREAYQQLAQAAWSEAWKAAWHDIHDKQQSMLLHEVLTSFCCPISYEILCDPVVAGDGHTYERETIELWFGQSSNSPLTGSLLPHRHLLPNHAMRMAVEEYLQRLAEVAGGQAQHLMEELRSRRRSCTDGRASQQNKVLQIEQTGAAQFIRQSAYTLVATLLGAYLFVAGMLCTAASLAAVGLLVGTIRRQNGTQQPDSHWAMLCGPACLLPLHFTCGAMLCKHHGSRVVRAGAVGWAAGCLLAAFVAVDSKRCLGSTVVWIGMPQARVVFRIPSS